MNIEDSIKTLKEFNKIKINSYAMQFVNISYPDLQEAIETLLTAYEKEKETNKQIKCKLDEKNIPIETLLAEFERLEDLEDDLTTVYLNGVYDGEKKVQDKIKAKIEELEKLQKEFPNNDEIRIKIIAYKELLEKE